MIAKRGGGKMQRITDGLDLAGRSVVSVIGCGGKTSLIAQLSSENPDREVLISPTTKMRPMDRAVGVFMGEKNKLRALPEAALAAIAPLYDLVLLEADGSRGLPCKGWLQSEPVVPAYTTHTVGVVTLQGLGQPATEGTCLRLPAFLALTGLRAGDPITPEALMAMVCSPQGMFWNAVGRRMLLVNRVEDDRTAALARDWCGGIQAAYPGLFERIIYGSIHQAQWMLQ